MALSTIVRDMGPGGRPAYTLWTPLLGFLFAGDCRDGIESVDKMMG